MATTEQGLPDINEPGSPVEPESSMGSESPVAPGSPMDLGSPKQTKVLQLPNDPLPPSTSPNEPMSPKLGSPRETGCPMSPKSPRTPKGNRPPGPRRFPVVGNLLQCTGHDMFYVKLNEFRKEYGDVLYLELGAVKMLVVFGHEQVKRVLEDEQDRFKYRPAYLVEVKGLELFKGNFRIKQVHVFYKVKTN